jgi:hypothetical protein
VAGFGEGILRLDTGGTSIGSCSSKEVPPICKPQVISARMNAACSGVGSDSYAEGQRAVRLRRRRAHRAVSTSDDFRILLVRNEAKGIVPTFESMAKPDVVTVLARR